MSSLAKKMLVGLLSVCMVLPVVACGGGGGGGGGGSYTGYEFNLEDIQAKYDDAGYVYDTYSGGDITITLDHWDSAGADNERSVLNQLLLGFNERYPDITVQLGIIGDYETTYTQRVNAGNVADVFMVPDGQFLAWKSANRLTNLSSLISGSELIKTDDIITSALTRYQSGGGQYALPKDISCHAMYYNKEIFDYYGVAYPASDRIMTIEEAIDMWSEFDNDNSNSNSVYGVVGLGEVTSGLVWSAGGDFLNDSRNGYPTATADTTALRRAYSFIQNSYFANGGPYDGVTGHKAMSKGIQPTASVMGTASATDFFVNGRAATCIAGNWNNMQFMNNPFEWDVTYIPAFAENPTANGWSGSVGYTMKTTLTGDKKQAAWALIEYICSEEGQEILSLTGFQFPVYEELGKGDFLSFVLEDSSTPRNFVSYIEQAAKQPASLFTYTRDKSWKDVYDGQSAKLTDENASTRYSVDTYLSTVKGLIDAISSW